MTTPSDIAVRIEGVSKRYRIGAARSRQTFREALAGTLRRREPEAERDLWALRDVSFEVRRGEAMGIIGQNGAGKSTLLKILSRITEPTAGRIEIRGRVSSLLEVGTGFHPELTGRENIALNGAILGMTRAEIRARFDEIVAFAEVERFIETPVKYYSSGMYMRLAFAVAAHLEPEILIVDEVLAVGDAAFQSKCLRKMNDVAKHGRTVLFVSHNMPAVRSLCSSAVRLSAGVVEDSGASTDVVDRYLRMWSSAALLPELLQSLDLPANETMRFTAIDIRQQGQSTTTIDSGNPLELHFAFEVFRSTFGLHVWFGLYDLDDQLVFETLHNGDSAEPPQVEAGRYLAVATIPPDFLAPRPYQLRILASVANVGDLMDEPIRIPIEVIAGGIVNRAYPGFVTSGRVAPRIPWSVARD